MGFELRDLREAAERYTGHNEGTHGIWPKLVWQKRMEPPEDRLEDAVNFLGKWKALRFKGGGGKFRAVYNAWLPNCLHMLEQLRDKDLYHLTPADFQIVYRLSSTLRGSGIPPTTFGKLLHFLAPSAVLLWDEKIVRHCYRLDPTPRDFVSYQCYGTRLLHHLTRKASFQAIEELEKIHARSAGYFEPVTMILDHLAYFPETASRAVQALGESKNAFSLDFAL